MEGGQSEYDKIITEWGSRVTQSIITLSANHSKLISSRDKILDKKEYTENEIEKLGERLEKIENFLYVK